MGLWSNLFRKEQQKQQDDDIIHSADDLRKAVGDSIPIFEVGKLPERPEHIEEVCEEWRKRANDS